MAIKVNLGNPIRPLAIDNGMGALEFAGMAFELKKSGLFITSSHVLGQISEPKRVHIFLDYDNYPQATTLYKHPRADVAVLIADHAMDLSPLELDRGPEDHEGSHNFGQEVMSYGYPSRPIDSNKFELEPRLMRGSVQRKFKYRGYSEYELSFPVLHGQSGSPVLLSNPPNSVIGVVTTSFESHIILPDSYEEITEHGEKTIYEARKVVSYGICAELWSISEWILNIAG